MPCYASKCVAICLTSQKRSLGSPGPPWSSSSLRVYSKLGGPVFGTPGFSRAQVRQPSITASWGAYPSPLRTEETLPLTGLWVPGPPESQQCCLCHQQSDLREKQIRPPSLSGLSSHGTLTLNLASLHLPMRAREGLVLRLLWNCLKKAWHMCIYRYMCAYRYMYSCVYTQIHKCVYRYMYSWSALVFPPYSEDSRVGVPVLRFMLVRSGAHVRKLSSRVWRPCGRVSTVKVMCLHEAHTDYCTLPCEGESPMPLLASS